jgi:hypothetical protein
MHSFAPVFVALILLAALAVATLSRRFAGAPRAESTHTYEAVALLTPAERSFFGVLRQVAAPLDYQVFAKVRLADIVRPVRSPSRSGWQSAFNRIAGKHVDFLLCDTEQLRIVTVVELDDSTHRRFERGFRDDLVDSALAEAGIPILRIPARESYSPAWIREQIESLSR